MEHHLRADGGGCRGCVQPWTQEGLILAGAQRDLGQVSAGLLRVLQAGRGEPLSAAPENRHPDGASLPTGRGALEQRRCGAPSCRGCATAPCRRADAAACGAAAGGVRLERGGLRRQGAEPGGDDEALPPAGEEPGTTRPSRAGGRQRARGGGASRRSCCQIEAGNRIKLRLEGRAASGGPRARDDDGQPDTGRAPDRHE
mmetsp:Transcript_47918/g.138654  ORF Transcript_47918/g.138654 Transcript_47918/m.138654 type:complete len:200 (-) Transcript_47918:1070-1669(-)